MSRLAGLGWGCLAIAALAGCQQTRAEAGVAPQAEARVRFAKYTGKYAYGLTVIPPWQGGGKLIINLPEHLEYQGGRGILRHNDKKPHGHWQVAADGRSATLNVESPTAPGVRVKGLARAVGGGRVEIAMTIANQGKQDFTRIKPLYCHRYRHLTGFPQWVGNLKHTYVLIDGRLVALAGAKTRNTSAKVKAATVRGCDQKDTGFAARGGGVIEEGIDAAISAVTALDGGRKLLIAWTPGKSLLSNANIPCLHADPFYGPIRAGQTRTTRGVILFTEAPLEQAVRTLKEEGAGAPARDGAKRR